MIRTLTRALPYLLLFPAILPLVYIDGLLYPYLAPKTLLFRADWIFAMAAFIFLALTGHQFHVARLREWYTWLPAVLLVIAYVMSLLGVDFYHSFWSIFDRGDGLLTLTAIVGFFYMFLLVAEEKLIQQLFKITAWVASIVAIHGALQWLQQASGMEIPLISAVDGRIGGTLGNAAFLASYLGLTFFITLLVAESMKGRWRMLMFSSAGLHLIVILLSATRGTLLAFIVAGGAALLYGALRGEIGLRNYSRIGLVALVIIAGLFVTFRTQLSTVPFEPIARVASISLRDVTVESRVFIWTETLRTILSEPFAATGAEHIQVLFNKFYDPTAIVEQWFDRSHNAFLDYAVQYSMLGLLVYVGILIVFAKEAYSRLKNEGIGIKAGFLFVLLGIVYVVQNLFVFDTALTLWLFLIVLALLFAMRDSSRGEPLPIPKIPHAVAGTVAALVALLIIPVSFLPLRANWLLASGYTYHVYDVRRAVSSMEKGYALNTYADLEYGYQLYEMYTERQTTMLKGEARLIAYRFAEKVLAENYARYPYDARTATYYAHVLDVAPPEIARNDEQLRQVLAHAIDLSPKRIQPWYLLANISIRAGDALQKGDPNKNKHYLEAVQALTQYSELVPRMAEPRFVLATLYLTVGDKVNAKKWADEALPLYTSDLATARRAARYYVTVEDWEHARFFLREVFTMSPAELNIKYDLAKAEFLSGNIEKAKQMVAELRVEAPGLVERDKAFMDAVAAE